MAADVREDETNVDQSQYEVAAAEWSNVAEVTLARTSRGAEAEDGEAAPAECPVSPLVSVADITEHLRTQPDMVSCDWRRAGHVTTLLTSDWSRTPSSPRSRRSSRTLAATTAGCEDFSAASLDPSLCFRTSDKLYE